MEQISRAANWLNISHALAKSESPDVAAYKMSNYDVAICAIELLDDIKQHLVPLDNKDLIAVAVDDMKIITALMKLVVVCGIYPLLTGDRMVQLAPRVPDWVLPDPSDHAAPPIEVAHQLRTLNKRVVDLVTGDDDVSNLLLISPFMVDLLALASVADNASFLLLVSKLPTYKVYQFLIQLRGVERPSPAVAKILSEMVIRRKDAVGTLIELFIEMSGNEVDLSALGKATLALASMPKSTSPKLYIEALGSQLFTILSRPVAVNPDAPAGAASDDAPVVRATISVVNELSRLNPRLLGHLRDQICSPFLSSDQKSGPVVSSSGNALFRILRSGGSFAEHLFSRLVLSLWLLLCSTQQTAGGADAFVMKLLIEGLQLVPESAQLLVKNMLLYKLVPNLNWLVREGEEPILIASINVMENSGLVKQMDSRAALLAHLVSQLSDSSTTGILIGLMRSWTLSGADDESAPMEKLLMAKSIEVLSSDPEIKKKLFNNPVEIINFAFSIIESSVKTSQPKLLASDPPKLPLAKLNIGDSDDEDSDDEDDALSAVTDKMRADSPLSSEDDVILDICLNLLGSVLMEATAEQDYTISAERKSYLKEITTNPRFSPSIRARADFCYEIADGGARFKDDSVNMESDGDVKAAAYAALREPLVPSRAFGIHLISTLVDKSAIPLSEAMAIYLQNLEDDDSYIYMNAIKAIDNATKTHPAAVVIEYLVPSLISDSNRSLDTQLRVREALVRLLTPGSMAKCDSGVIDALLKDLHSSAVKSTDIRIRMSSASILGIIIAQFPLSLTNAQQEDAVDCARGVLIHERSIADVALIKASVVLALEIFNAHNEGFFPKLTTAGLSSLLIAVKLVLRETSDKTLQDLAQEVIKSSESVSV